MPATVGASMFIHLVWTVAASLMAYAYFISGMTTYMVIWLVGVFYGLINMNEERLKNKRDF